MLRIEQANLQQLVPPPYPDETPTGDLVYAWTLVTRPAGSAAVLTGANTANPSFRADVVGTYLVELVVTDEDGQTSGADGIVISSENVAPTADAGLNTVVRVRNRV